MSDIFEDVTFQCGQCMIYFPTENSLKLHCFMEEHEMVSNQDANRNCTCGSNKKEPHQCATCKLVGVSLDGQRARRSTADQIYAHSQLWKCSGCGMLWKCIDCGVLFKGSNMFRQHMPLCQEVQETLQTLPFQCKECKNHFPTEKSLELHCFMLEHEMVSNKDADRKCTCGLNEEEPHQCATCKLIRVSLIGQRAIRRVADECYAQSQLWKCSGCGILWKCIVCGVFFKGSNMFEQHIPHCQDIEETLKTLPFQCKQCKNHFPTENSLELHCFMLEYELVSNKDTDRKCTCGSNKREPHQCANCKLTEVCLDGQRSAADQLYAQCQLWKCSGCGMLWKCTDCGVLFKGSNIFRQHMPHCQNVQETLQHMKSEKSSDEVTDINGNIHVKEEKFDIKQKIKQEPSDTKVDFNTDFKYLVKQEPVDKDIKYPVKNEMNGNVKEECDVDDKSLIKQEIHEISEGNLRKSRISCKRTNDGNYNLRERRKK